MLNIYRASAGSGKTYRLTQDYIRLLFSPQREDMYRHILAVTFTNKATDEMKSRILNELNKLSEGLPSNYRADLMQEFHLTDEEVNQWARKILISILYEYSLFSISTIDTFFQQVIRSFAREIGIHGGYKLEMDTELMLNQAVDNLFFELSQKENEQLLNWLIDFAEETIEQTGSWNLENKIKKLGNEIFKENYQYKVEEINVKLHDRDFLRNYIQKIKKIKIDFETKVKQTAEQALHILASYDLKHEDFKYSVTKNFEKLKNGNFEISNRFIDCAYEVTNCYKKDANNDIINIIEQAYQKRLQQCFISIVELFDTEFFIYNSTLIVLKNINTLGILTDIAAQIKKLTTDQNAMLISDVNLLLNRIIDRSDAPYVFEKIGTRLEHFMIDEFQDTSVLQWKNFYPLILNSLSDGKFNLVVGDVKQSIYRWRNSDWKILDEQIYNDFSSEQLYEENLATNWRSDKNIVEFNNAFFFQAARLLQSKLNEAVKDALSQYNELNEFTTKIEHAYSNVYQQISPKTGLGHIKFTFIDEEENEEGWQAESLNRLPSLLEDLQERGYQPKDIAILVRKNEEAQAVVEKLLNYKTTPDAKENCCYDVLGNEGLLIGNSGSVRFILGILYLFINQKDSIQQIIVNYEYAKGRLKKSENEALQLSFSEVDTKKDTFSPLFTREENDQLKYLQHCPLYDMVEGIISLFEVGNWQNEAVFVQAFQDLVFDFSVNKTADLNSFLEWWEETGSQQFIPAPENQNAIRIMTIHKAKGLAFKVVILPFCEWNMDTRQRNILWCEPQISPFNEFPLLPIEYTSKLENSIFTVDYFNEQLHLYIDNLNIAYVAFTRAKNELIGFCKMPKKNSKVTSLSTLLMTSFENVAENSELNAHFSSETNTFEWGEPTIAFKEAENENFTSEKINCYPSVSSKDRLKIRSQNFIQFLDEQHLTDTRLNYGIVMHEVLRQMITRNDQEKAIQKMIMMGAITVEESKIVEQELESFWNLPETKEWFGANVKIMNEVTILTPSGEQFRPDRVVIHGNEAMVVDYKFGEKESENHLRQVKQYMNLISQMGYAVKGYVCYVSLGKVMEVN